MAYERFPLNTADIDELKTKLDAKLVNKFFAKSEKNQSDATVLNFFKNSSDTDPTFSVSIPNSTTLKAWFGVPDSDFYSNAGYYADVKDVTVGENTGFGYLYLNDNGFVLTTTDGRAICMFYKVGESKQGLIFKRTIKANSVWSPAISMKEEESGYILFRYEPLLAQTLFSISPVCYLGLDEGYSEYAYITVASTMAAPSGVDYDNYSIIELGDNQFLATYAWAFKLQ